MARASSPSGIIPNPNVWNSGSDDFSHTQLAANWDTVDANLTMLQDERMPIGSVVMWWRRTTNDPIIPWGTASVWQPCDGRTIIAANHSFPGGGNLVLPDMRNQVPFGAGSPDGSNSNPTLTYPGDGVAPPTQASGPTNAGGIGGEAGSMNQAIVPAHYHQHSHVHQLAVLSHTDVLVATQDDSSDPYFVNIGSSGSGNNVSLTNHVHKLQPQYTSNARDATNQNKRTKDVSGMDASQNNELGTSEQQLATGGTASVPTGGTSGDNLAIDARPAVYGFVFMMKVLVAPLP